jgi:hypothetical protein
MYNDLSAVLLMYVVVPIWLAAGFAAGYATERLTLPYTADFGSR